MNFDYLIKEQAIKQEHLALKLGTTQQCISSWIKGRTSPNIKYLPLLANLLNTTIDTVVNALIEAQEQNATKNKDNESI